MVVADRPHILRLKRDVQKLAIAAIAEGFVEAAGPAETEAPAAIACDGAAQKVLQRGVQIRRPLRVHRVNRLRDGPFGLGGGPPLFGENVIDLSPVALRRPRGDKALSGQRGERLRDGSPRGAEERDGWAPRKTGSPGRDRKARPAAPG